MLLGLCNAICHLQAWVANDSNSPARHGAEHQQWQQARGREGPARVLPSDPPTTPQSEH